MSLDILKKRIKENKISGVFLFMGKEEYTKDHYVSVIRKKVDSSPLPEFNHIIFDASVQSVSELEDAAFSLPYMWESKLIEITNLDTSKMTESLIEDYERVFSDVPDYLTILIVFRSFEFSDENNKSNKKKPQKGGISSFVEMVKKYGLAVNFDTEASNKLVTWIIRHFNAAKVAFEQNVPKEILNYCGSDMYVLQGELLKLSAAYTGKPITVADVHKYCSQNISYKYFDIAAALNRRDIVSAKRILDGLKLKREEVPMAIGFLAKNYSEMLLVKTGIESGMSYDALSKELKIPSWRIGKIASAVYNTDIKAISFASSAIANADVKIKTLRGNAKKVLELAFYRICAYG